MSKNKKKQGSKRTTTLNQTSVKKCRATKEYGPIVIDCEEIIKRKFTDLTIKLGIKNYVHEFEKRSFSVILKNFEVVADFSIGSEVKKISPSSSLTNPIGILGRTSSEGAEVQTTLGSESSISKNPGNVFKVLASLQRKRSRQLQNQITREFKIVEILSHIPSSDKSVARWKVVLHSPESLSRYFDSSENYMDFYNGIETLKASADMSGRVKNTKVFVYSKGEDIRIIKNYSLTKYSKFIESVTFFELRAKKYINKHFEENLNLNSFIEIELEQ